MTSPPSNTKRPSTPHALSSDPLLLTQAREPPHAFLVCLFYSNSTAKVTKLQHELMQATHFRVPVLRHTAIYHKHGTIYAHERTSLCRETPGKRTCRYSRSMATLQSYESSGGRKSQNVGLRRHPPPLANHHHPIYHLEFLLFCCDCF